MAADKSWLGDLIRSCSACEWRRYSTAPVPGSGPIPCRVMFIAQNPAKEEDNRGEPLVGQAGKMFNSILQGIGVFREEVYLANTVCCRGPTSDAVPPPAIVRACSHWLDLELSVVQPEIVVLMGAPAMKRLLGPDCGTVEHLHGKPIVSDGRVYLPCYHPAAAIHDTALLRHLYDDFRILRGLLAGVPPSDYIIRDLYPNPIYTEITSEFELHHLESDIASAGFAAADVETVNNKLWSVQVSLEPGTSYFIGGDLAPLFRFPTTAEIVFHYYLYDYHFIQANRFLDTIIMAYLLGLPQGLKELASRFCGMEMQSYSDMVSAYGHDKAIAFLEQVSGQRWPNPEPIIESAWDNKAGMVISKTHHPQPVERRVKRILADIINEPETDPFTRWNAIDGFSRRNVESVLGPMPGSTIADVDHDKAVWYSSRDPDATLRVYQALLPRIHELGLDYVLRSIDLPILSMVQEMMDIGFAVDRTHLSNLSTDYARRMADIAEKLASQVGHTFNPGSSQQVAEVVYGELGFKPTKRTTTGIVSTDDQELKKVKHPVVNGILEYRRLAKNKDSFADALLGRSVSHPDGTNRVHTTIKTTRTETGRLSSADPNLQAQPTRNKEGKAIRKGFVASPGWRLGEGDVSQAEVRVLAHESKCEALIELFNRGGDPHTETAMRIFGLPEGVARQEKYRYPTKRLNFGVIYMISPEGLSAEITEYISDLIIEGTPVEIEPWSVDDCSRLITDWYKLYPEVRDYQFEKVAQARRYGYVTDMFGRIRYVPEVYCPIRSVQEAGARQAGNMPIQAAVAGIVKIAMARLWRERPRLGWQNKVRFLMQIHDSVVLEIVDDDAFIKGCGSWLIRALTQTVKLLVPLEAEFKIGQNWGEMKELEVGSANGRG